MINATSFPYVPSPIWQQILKSWTQDMMQVKIYKQLVYFRLKFTINTNLFLLPACGVNQSQWPYKQLKIGATLALPPYTCYRNWQPG